MTKKCIKCGNLAPSFINIVGNHNSIKLVIVTTKHNVNDLVISSLWNTRLLAMFSRIFDASVLVLLLLDRLARSRKRCKFFLFNKTHTWHRVSLLFTKLFYSGMDVPFTLVSALGRRSWCN